METTPSFNEKTFRDVASSYWWYVQQILYAHQVLSDNPMYTRDFINDHCWATYSMNQTRIELHQAMCETLGLTEEQTRPVTDNMEDCEDFDDFCDKLLKLRKQILETSNDENKDN